MGARIPTARRVGLCTQPPHLASWLARRVPSANEGRDWSDGPTRQLRVWFVCKHAVPGLNPHILSQPGVSPSRAGHPSCLQLSAAALSLTAPALASNSDRLLNRLLRTHCLHMVANACPARASGYLISRAAPSACALVLPQGSPHTLSTMLH